MSTRPRLPLGGPRLQLFDLTQHCLAAIGDNPSRGARLIVHLCEGLHLALLDLGGAELRARKAEAALAQAEKTIATLEARVRSEIDIPTMSQSPRHQLALCR